MRTRIARWLLEVALVAVPSKWRASVRQDLDEERAEGVSAAAACWHALAIGLTLRRHGQIDPRRRARAFQAARGDFVHALRGIRREPGANAAVILTLAIGIGAASAAHAVFNFALFRPTPGVSDEAALVSVQNSFTVDRNGEPMRVVEGTPPSRLRVMRAGTPGLTGLTAAGFSFLPFSPIPGEAPRTFRIWWTTRDYFQVLGVRARIGNLFIGDDYDAPGSTGAVISEYLWRREFDRRPDIIGRSIAVNGDVFTIRGVTDAFRGPDKIGNADVWLPASASRTFTKSTAAGDWPDAPSLVGRLSPGATRDVVEAQLQASWTAAGGAKEGNSRMLPRVYKGFSEGNTYFADRLLTIYRVVMAGVSVLLLLACANAANLLLSKHSRRGRELAVRTAIGASRWRLVRMMLVEAGVTSLLAAGVSLVIAVAALQAFTDLRLVNNLPVLDDLAIDWRVVVFALAVSGATLFASSIVPALIASRPNPIAALQLHSAPTTIRATRLRMGLVVVQLAASLVLMIGAGVLVQTVKNLRGIDIGLDSSATMLVQIRADQLGYQPAERRRVLTELMTALRATPGIERAAAGKSAPLRFTTRMTVNTADGRGLQVVSQQASEDYFDALRIKLLAGRVLAAADLPAVKGGGVIPAVVNARFVDVVFNGEPALGRQFQTEAGIYEVVGVVTNTKTSDVRADYQAAVFEPFDNSRGVAGIVLRTTLPPAKVTALVRAAVTAIDPRIPMDDVHRVDEDIDNRISEERLLARLSSMVAAISVMLAFGGLYAVVAFFVGERTREFGIRLALGAPRARIATSILRRVSVLCACGCLVGAVVIAWAGPLIASRLFGITALDARTIAAAVTVLLMTALLAAWLPARRASRIDPAITLRT